MFCSICGVEMKQPAFAPGEFEDVCPKCYHTRYWDLIVKEKDEHLFVNGKCYFVGDEQSRSSFRGFDGATFKYELFSEPGVVHKSTNMWFNGEVPIEYRDKLPDTAKWVK